MLKEALAAYRLTHLFVYEDGPFGIFDWIRHKAGISIEVQQGYEWWWTAAGEVRSEEVSRETVHTDGFWAELLACPLCLSVWFAGLVRLLPDFVVDWLSVAGICLLLFKRFE